MANYPSDRLIYYPYASDPILNEAVSKYFTAITLDNKELEAIKNYLLHWINLSSFVEEDREKLIKLTNSCQDSKNLIEITDSLLDHGIDPF